MNEFWKAVEPGVIALVTAVVANVVHGHIRKRRGRNSHLTQPSPPAERERKGTRCPYCGHHLAVHAFAEE